MKILNHKLCDGNGKPLDFRRSPNQSPSTITPEYSVMHYTAGASASSSIEWLLNKQAKASAHLVISRDGEITQLVAFNRKAWHAGVSQWAGRNGVNGFSIGIELDNVGMVQGAPRKWRTAWGHSVKDEDVIVLPHPFDGKERAWQIYTEIQLTTARDVAQLLMARYHLRDIVGHDDIAPGRKLDPGPAFPMLSFRSIIMGRSDDEPERYQTTTALNIRTGPGTQFDKLPHSPLPKGTRLEVLSTDGVWYQTDVLDAINGDMDIHGWVHSRYVQQV